jgi:hypothetical protein
MMRKANFGSPENGTLIASHGFAIEDNRFKDVPVACLGEILSGFAKQFKRLYANHHGPPNIVELERELIQQQVHRQEASGSFANDSRHLLSTLP